MERKWTDAQSAAINTRNKTLLVSAAAGSGKTAALTERIIRSLTDTEDPSDIDRLLIVTFTRAAAAELRQRITSAISDALAKDPQNKHLSRQLLKVSGAKISTIDSFYLDVIRSNFEKLDISPSFRTADEAELDILSRSVMEDTVDAFYESRGADFTEVAECFVNVRNSDSLSDIFLDLYSSTESLPEGIEFLTKAAELCENDCKKDLFEGHFGKLIKQELLETYSYYLGVYNEMCEWIETEEKICDKYLPAFIYDRDHIASMIDKLTSGASYKDCKALLDSYSSPSLGRVSDYKNDTAEEYKELRNKFKDKRKALAQRFFGAAEQNNKALLLKTAGIIRLLYDLLCDFEKRLAEEKKQKNICSFSDIRRYAMTLLVNSDGTPTQTALALRERYDTVYIDEYQDVDRVQDRIFKAISNPTGRFMVGDIKQSIYGFRGAEPQVFADYRNDFPELCDSESDKNEASIFMSNNFRCDNTVIRFTNEICSRLFSVCKETMGYTENDDLIFSKVTKDRVTDEVPVSVKVLVNSEATEDDNEYNENDLDDSEDETAKEQEAKLIALEIKKLLSDGRKADGTPIYPHDIAVLFRSKSMGTIVKEALENAGISCSDSSDSRYFENPDVLLVLCLLNAIDNPQRDVYLAGVLRSPFFDFSLDELIEIRKSADNSLSLYDALCVYKKNKNELAKKCTHFENTLDKFRDAAVSLSVDRLIRYLYSTEFFTVSGLVNANSENNLMRLYEYARTFEASSFKGLYSFIVYINRIIEQDKRIGNASSDTTEGKVTLMTIHHSKGLEFPVCILAGAGSYFNFKETRESMVCAAPYGIAMKVTDGSGYARIDTSIRQALLAVNKRKQVEEDMRVLYVALTRARERLIVTASARTTEEKLVSRAKRNRRLFGGYTVRSARSYLDWILPSFDIEHTNDFCKIDFIERSALDTTDDMHQTVFDDLHDNSSIEFKTAKEDAEKILADRFSFVYPYAHATTLPAKIALSKLPLPESESDAEIEVKEPRETIKSTYQPHPSLLDEKRAKKPTSAERGTATHLFLQFCDYKNVERFGVKNEMARLIEKKFVPKNLGELVFCDELELFFKSDIYKLTKNAKKIYREQRFNILLPPSVMSKDKEFLEQTNDEFLAVQGVIDLMIEDENGDIILCDYKTDRLTGEEKNSDELLCKKMNERHAPQLSYYAEAVKRLFGKECKHILVYSTCAAKSIKINILTDLDYNT